MNEVAKEQNSATLSTPSTHEAQAIDQGLRSYMLHVYNYMGLGVAVTACVVMAALSIPGVAEFAYAARFPIFAAVIVMGFASPWIVGRRSELTAQIAYWSYCVLWGLAAVPLVYMVLSAGLEVLIFKALALAAVMFLTASLVGYTTRMNLASIGGIVVLAAIGLVAAIVLNYFIFESSDMSFFISIAGVVIFTVATAWETQEIKNMYVENYGETRAIFGAFLIYGSFMALFMNLLRLLWYIAEEA